MCSTGEARAQQNNISSLIQFNGSTLHVQADTPVMSFPAAAHNLNVAMTQPVEPEATFEANEKKKRTQTEQPVVLLNGLSELCCLLWSIRTLYPGHFIGALCALGSPLPAG